jgi:hypothetical protein
MRRFVLCSSTATPGRERRRRQAMNQDNTKPDGTEQGAGSSRTARWRQTAPEKPKKSLDRKLDDALERLPKRATRSR